MFFDYLEFLSDTNEHIKAVSQAKDMDELLCALSSTPAVWAPQIVLASSLVGKTYTERLRRAVCDFSLTVLNDAGNGRSEDKCVVIRCSPEIQGTFSAWQIDTRFGRGGTIKRKSLDRFIDAFHCTLADYHDMYYNGVKGLKEVLDGLHSNVVILSRVVGTQKALEIFTKCVAQNGFEVVDTSGVSSRKFGPITVCRASTGRRYRVGATASKKR
jgi:hypothetical protein